jgi:hypothetical protein
VEEDVVGDVLPYGRRRLHGRRRRHRERAREGGEVTPTLRTPIPLALLCWLCARKWIWLRPLRRRRDYI